MTSNDIEEAVPDTHRTSDESEPLLPPAPIRGHHRQHFHMDLNPTVYTSILYAPAISRIKGGSEMSFPTRLSIALITLNMILQVGLLRIMDVYGHRDSQQSVAGLLQQEENDNFLKQAYEATLTPHERDVVKEATTMLPLCTVSSNGTYTCMPTSLQFVSKWHDLDLDGDGVWTISEALATEKKMNKEHGMETKGGDWILRRPTIIFNNIVNGLKMRAVFAKYQLNQTFYIAHDVESRLAIPKAYFDYWMGDAMMCTRFDQSACENTVASGLFNAALTNGRMGAAHKGIVDLDSATRYCEMMLANGGGCEQSLPPSFTENLHSRRSLCGSTSLRAVGMFANPHDPMEAIPVMKPSYSFLAQQKRSVDALFLFFKALIMFLFYSSLIDEVRDLIKTGEFLVRFPGVRHAADRGGMHMAEEAQGPEKKKFRITGISRKHRAGMVLVWLLRIVILMIMIRFGSWFLLSEGRYIELVLNALALSFITGIDEVLYGFLESSERRDDGFDDVEPVRFETSIPHEKNTWTGWLFRKEFWGLFVLPVISVICVLWNAHFVRQPLMEALTCTCMQEGDNCAESMSHQEAWWKQYWTHILPAAMHQIEALRLQGM